MIKIGKRIVTEVITEYGVKWKDDFGDEVFMVECKAEAKHIANITGGRIVRRKFYVTEWK